MICMRCGSTFDEPKVRRYYDRFEQNYMSPPDYLCPVCGSDELEEEC